MLLALSPKAIQVTNTSIKRYSGWKCKTYFLWCEPTSYWFLFPQLALPIYFWLNTCTINLIIYFHFEHTWKLPWPLSPTLAKMIWNLNVIIHDPSPLDSENALLSIRIFSITLIASWSKCVVCNNPVFSNAPNSLEKKITLSLIS